MKEDISVSYIAVSNKQKYRGVPYVLTMVIADIVLTYLNKWKIYVRNK